MFSKVYRKITNMKTCTKPYMYLYSVLGCCYKHEDTQDSKRLTTTAELQYTLQTSTS